MDYNYSLIIPHYNIPRLLKRLLQSVPARADMQIIVVDDCSTEELDYFESLKKDFTKVEWYSTGTNGGGGKARNIGIRYAKGKYLIFADADDYFEDEFNSILNDYMQKNIDIIYFNGISRDSDTNAISNRAQHLNRYIMMFNEGTDPEALNLRYLFGEPWCKFIRKSVINKNNIKYDETNIHNDTTFSYLIGYYAKTILVDNRILYCITTRKESVSKEKSDDRILTRVEIFSRAEIFFNNHKIPIKVEEHYKQLISLYINCRFSLLKKCIRQMRSIGISLCHILSECFILFFSIIKKRITNKCLIKG